MGPKRCFNLQCLAIVLSWFSVTAPVSVVIGCTKREVWDLGPLLHSTRDPGQVGISVGFFHNETSPNLETSPNQREFNRPNQSKNSVTSTLERSKLS